jgi:hypothetical protein
MGTSVEDGWRESSSEDCAEESAALVEHAATLTDARGTPMDWVRTQNYVKGSDSEHLALRQSPSYKFL